MFENHTNIYFYILLRNWESTVHLRVGVREAIYLSISRSEDPLGHDQRRTSTSTGRDGCEELCFMSRSLFDRADCQNVHC